VGLHLRTRTTAAFWSTVKARPLLPSWCWRDFSDDIVWMAKAEREERRVPLRECRKVWSRVLCLLLV
jgi:hypothetical protein